MNTLKIECKNNERASGSIIQEQKPRGDEKLWRYMSIDKFVHMILHRYIFVPAIKKFDDKNEGDYIVKIINKHYQDKHDPKVELNKIRNNFFALCFHNMEYENELMWRAYASQGGVALVTSVNKLANANFELDSSNTK